MGWFKGNIIIQYDIPSLTGVVHSQEKHTPLLLHPNSSPKDQITQADRSSVRLRGSRSRESESGRKWSRKAIPAVGVKTKIAKLSATMSTNRTLMKRLKQKNQSSHLSPRPRQVQHFSSATFPSQQRKMNCEPCKSRLPLLFPIQSSHHRWVDSVHLVL